MADRKVDFDRYTDREIVSAVMALPAAKFLRVLNGISAVSLKFQKRGELIARDISEAEIDEIIRKLGES